MKLPELPQWLPIAVDTETGPDTGYETMSGNSLYADSGARVAVVSLGWVDPQIVTAGGEQLREAITTGAGVTSTAFPFSQGKLLPNGEQKPGVQLDLHEASQPVNLGLPQWRELNQWLDGRPLVMQNSKFDLPLLRYWPLGWRNSVERCPIHGRLVSWKEGTPADEATWTPSVTETASANSANTKTTAPAGQRRVGGRELPAERASSNTTAGSAPAAGKRGARSSNSTTSTATGQPTEPKSGQANNEAEQGTPPTGGSKLTGTLPGSKSYARTATALRSALKGAHPDTDCTCVMQGELPDLEKLRYRPQCWEQGEGADRLDQLLWDTQVASSVIWPEYYTSLKPTARRLWSHDEGAEADALQPHLGPKSNPRFDLVPWEVIEPYAAKDADLTIRLFYHQLDQLGMLEDGPDDPTLAALVDRETRFAKALYRMERAGVPFDPIGSLQAAEQLRTSAKLALSRLPFNGGINQAKKFFFGSGATSLGLPVSTITKTGQASLTDQVLDQLIDQYPDGTPAGQAARDYKQANQYNGAASRWYEPYALGTGKDMRLRCCFRQVSSGRGADGGTVSGRLSVERVNLQAIPHDYRLKAWPVATPRQLIGRAAEKLPGWELWEFDLQQAELRAAAAYAQCTPMLQMLANGSDLHGATTTSIFNVSPESPEWGRWRQVGKRANFSCLFGVGAATFAQMVAKETGLYLSNDEAYLTVNAWNGLYPEFKRANAKWSQIATDKRELRLGSREGFWTGKRRVFTDSEVARAGGKGLSKAFNQLVQGTLAEFLRDWLLEVELLMTSHGLGQHPIEGVGWAGLVMTIHDSLVCLLPADRAALIADEITGLAERLWGEYFRVDPLGRVAAVAGGADAARWTSEGK